MKLFNAMGHYDCIDKKAKWAQKWINDKRSSFASRLIGFFTPDLLTLIERSPELGNQVLLNLSKVLGERLRRTNQEIAKSSE